MNKEELTKFINEKQLTTNFRLSEFFVTNGEGGREGLINDLSRLHESQQRIYLFAIEIIAGYLQRVIRDKYGPVKITSAYRSPRLNGLIKGANTSMHILGLAVDFTIIGFTKAQMGDVYRYLKDVLRWSGGLAFNAKENFIHMDWGKGRKFSYS
jgi:uncharacterized protein YcbK (DUF882 family)